MNAIIDKTNSVGYAFIEFALPMLIQASVLIILLLLADLVLRKRVRAVFRYWILMLILVKLVLPTSLSGPFSLGYWFGDEIASVDVSQSSYEPLAAISESPAPVLPYIDVSNVRPTIYPPPTTASMAEAEVAPAEPIVPPPVQIQWPGVVFLLWLAIVIALLLLLAQRAIFVQGLVAQAKDASRRMYDILDDCRKGMKVKRRPRLKVSANATSPAVCGLFRPVILVPHNLSTALGSEDLQVVLLHELAHIKRADLWVNLAQTLLQIIYFYNPLLWLANAVIRRAREQAVDEAVLVAMGEKASRYPETLVSVAKLAFKRPTLSLRLIGVVESKSALAARIKRILSRPIPKSAKLGILGLAAIIVTAAFILPMAQARGYTERAAKVMKLAEKEARGLNHAYIGTEHILLALAEQSDGVAAKVLDKLGVSKNELQGELKKLVKTGSEAVRRSRLPQTPRAKKALEHARDEARTLDHDYIGTEHILLGLMQEKNGIAAQMLAKLGVSFDVARAEVFDFVKVGPNANVTDAGGKDKDDLTALDYARTASNSIAEETPSSADDIASLRIVGQVSDNVGKPIADAQVALSTADIGVGMSNGDLEPIHKEFESRIVGTDSAGRFDLGEHPDGDFGLVVVCDDGFAFVESQEFLASREIRIRPWGRIEGQLAPGRKASGSRIWMASLPNYTMLLHRWQLMDEGICDGNGRFVFEKVPAGWFEVGFLVRTGRSGSSITCRTPVVVEAGQTSNVTLGGVGRPVIGRFVPPAGYDKPIPFDEGLRSLVTARPKQPRPGNYEQMTQEQQRRWYLEWRRTDEYQDYLDAGWRNNDWRQYTFRIKEDGSFRIEDVIEGKYEMNVSIERLPGGSPGEEIAGYYGTVEVPAIAGGGSDEPLDLGMLDLHIVDEEPPHKTIATQPAYSAVLSNGVTVELVGVCEFIDGKAGRSWKPDGTSLEKAFYLDYGRAYSSKAFALVFNTDQRAEITKYDAKGATDRLSPLAVVDERGEMTDLTKAGRQHARAFKIDNLDSTELILGVAPKWRGKIRYDGKYVLSSADPNITFFETYETGEGVRIIFKNDYPRSESRLQAVLTSEAAEEARAKQRRSRFRVDATISVVQSGEGEKRDSAFFEDTKLSDVKYFELLTRALPRRVTFKNISLKPDVETDVGVDAIKSTWDKFSATLPNGVTVELVGICEHPSEGKQWWRPDGSLLKDSPYDDDFARAFPKGGEKGYKFAVKYSGMAGEDFDASVELLNAKTTNGGALFSASKKNGKENVKYLDGALDEKIVWMGAAFDEEVVACDMNIGVCFGDWKRDYEYETDRPNDAVEWAIFKKISLKPNFITLANGVTVERPATIRVPEDYPTVPEAVEAAEAGDMIVVSGSLAPDEEAWGEAVDGLQLRLRAEKLVWESSEAPILQADVRNKGTKMKAVPMFPLGYLVEIDGVSYSDQVVRSHWASDTWNAQVRLAPGEERIGVEISLDEHTKYSKGDLRGALGPGKHVVCIGFPHDDLASKENQFFSNPVEIEILPEEKTDVQVEPGSARPKYSATLANGVTVELVGVCEHPSEGKQWWGLDGRPIAAPYERLKSSHRSDDSELYEVVYRVLCSEDIRSHIYSNSTIGGHSGLIPFSQKAENLNIRDAANAYGAILYVKPDAEFIRLEIGAGRDSDWKTVCTQSGPVEETGTTCQGVMFQSAIEKDGETYVTIAHLIKDSQIRVIAVDHSGQIHESTGFDGTVGKELGSCQVRFDLPVEKIKEIQFQTQKFPRATFKNIPLRPGHKTDVEIEVERSASNDLKADSKRYQNITIREGVPIRQALQVLGKSFEKNIIVSGKVAGVVPVTNLFNVTFEEALRAILGTDKYTIDGNLIRVYTKEEFEAIYPGHETGVQVKPSSDGAEYSAVPANGITVRLGGTKPLGLFYSTNSLWFEVKNSLTEEIEFNQEPYAQKGTDQARWGYLEVTDADGNAVEYTWNPKKSMRKVKPGKPYRVNSFVNGRPLRRTGPGAYRARVTLVVRGLESDKNYEVKSNWHQFDVTACGHRTDFVSETAYDQLQQANAYLGMTGFGHATREEVIGLYEEIIEKYPNSKYELQGHFGIAKTASESSDPNVVTASDRALSRKHYQEIIRKWPDVVSHETIHARSQAYFSTPQFRQSRIDLYEWLLSLTRDEKINSIRNYFVLPFEPSESDVNRILDSLGEAIAVHVNRLKNYELVKVEPKLEFLAWHKTGRDNYWHAGGSVVSDEEELQILKNMSHPGCSDPEHSDYEWLRLAFSHPSFDEKSYVALRMIDDRGEHRKFVSVTAAGAENPEPRYGNRGWILYTVSVGSKEDFPQQSNFELDYAIGRWKTEIKKLAKDHNGIVSFGRGFLLGSIGQNAEDKTTISYTHKKTETSDQQHRFVAVTENGIVLPSGHVQGGYPDLFKDEFRFDIPLEEIQHFQFQTRAVKTATLKNIALRAGMKTDVQVEVEPMPEGYGPVDAERRIKGVISDFWTGIDSEDFEKVRRVSRIEPLGDPARLEQILAEVNEERKGLLSREIDISDVNEIRIEGNEAVAVGPANKDRFHWYFLQKDSAGWVIRLFDDAPPSLSIENVFLKCRSVSKLTTLGAALEMYAADNKAQFPDSLEGLGSYIRDAETFRWLSENIEYLGAGKRIETRGPGSIIAFPITLPEDENAFVLYDNASVGNELTGKLRLLEPAWGEAAAGVQVRLRPDKLVWEKGDDPTFKVDIRNVGTREMKTSLISSLALEVDGEVFGPRAWRQRGATRVADFAPGDQHTIKTRLSHFDLKSKGLDKPAPGKHTIKAVYLNNRLANGSLYTSLDKYDEMALASSNAVEIEIVPAGPPELVWGEEVGGLRAAVEFVPDKTSYVLGERADVRLHIQNVSDKDIEFASISTRQDYAKVRDGEGKEVKVDKKWHSGTVGPRRHTIKPGEILVLDTTGIGFGDFDDSALISPPKEPYYVGSIVHCEVGEYLVSYPINKELVSGQRKVTITARPQVDPRKYELVLERQSMLEAVNALMRKYRARICFEHTGSDSGAGQHVLTDAFFGSTVPELLDKLTEGSPYKWERFYRTYVVYPKQGSVLRYYVKTDIPDSPLDSVARKILDQDPNDNEIEIDAVFNGQTRKRLWISKHYAMYALARATDSAGHNDVVWSLTEAQGRRVLSFHKLGRAKMPAARIEDELLSSGLKIN